MLTQTFTVDGHLKVPPIGSCLPPLSQDIEMHFSLDMAQQVGCMHMWQSWVENVRYFMKIEFNTQNNTSGHRLCGLSIASAIVRARDEL